METADGVPIKVGSIVYTKRPYMVMTEGVGATDCYRSGMVAMIYDESYSVYADSEPPGNAGFFHVIPDLEPSYSFEPTGVAIIPFPLDQARAALAKAKQLSGNAG